MRMYECNCIFKHQQLYSQLYSFAILVYMCESTHYLTNIVLVTAISCYSYSSSSNSSNKVVMIEVTVHV